MSDRIKQLITELVKIAKARGISQAQLAELAGLTPVGLSKAKHRGDIRASSLEQLGAQLDLELALVPHRTRDEAIAAIKTGTFFQSTSETAAAYVSEDKET